MSAEFPSPEEVARKVGNFSLPRNFLENVVNFESLLDPVLNIDPRIAEPIATTLKDLNALFAAEPYVTVNEVFALSSLKGLVELQHSIFERVYKLLEKEDPLLPQDNFGDIDSEEVARFGEWKLKLFQALTGIDLSAD